MNEIFKFEDQDRNTTIKLLKNGENYILEVDCEGNTSTVVKDTDINTMANEYTTFLMGYVNRVKTEVDL